MSEYATKGAMLKCSCGAAPSMLQVTSNSLLSVQGNMVATTSDKIPMTNIMPFGICTVTRKPCNPSPLVWTGFLKSVGIPGGNPLLKTSTIQCSLGGSIKFQMSGQMKPSKVVINPDSPQIRALQKAAIESSPFCEECEKKKLNINPKILNILWINENNEFKELSELLPGQEVTLCINVEDGAVGEKIWIEINDDQGRKFKGGKDSLKYTGIVVEDDNSAYIDNFKIEYEEESTS